MSRQTKPDLNHRLATVLAVAGIAAFAILGSAFVYSNYLDARGYSVDAQARAYRDAFAIVRDLRRLDAALSTLPAAGPMDQEGYDRVLDALDFLYVRIQSLIAESQDSENGGKGSGEDVIQLGHAVLRLIEQADAMLVQAEDAGSLSQSLALNADALNTELMGYVDKQYFRQAIAVGKQTETLSRMTRAAIGLLGVISVVAIGAVLLYQRALVAQRRRRTADQRAHFLAYYDPMTGLANRMRFRQEAEHVFADNVDPMILLFDLDDFKGVNDRHGHAAGDAVLIRAASCIRSAVEEIGGTAARLGGDEFAAVVPGPVSSMRAAAFCEKLIADAARPFEAEGVRLTVGLSIGIAFLRSIDHGEADRIGRVQKAADIALYRAKEMGKRTYAFYDTDLADLVERRRDLEIGISDALRDDAFTLAFQPQIDLQNGEVKGFEALCRWSRDGVPVSPGEFISVAEATGQVVELDLWGLRKATRCAADWIRNGHMPVTISANLSPFHFRSSAIVDAVAEALAASGLPPHLLTLELTESAMIDDVAQVTVILEKLRRLGVRLALDDFGTGYSSLAYLRRLDVDIIKIDQSFVRDLERTPETRVILDALVALAQGLGKKLVVEGIETETQADILRGLGCHYGQGYLFSKPLPEAEARAMVPLLAANRASATP